MASPRPTLRTRACRSCRTDFIIVSQEPIFVQQDTDNTIFWSLPAGGAYFFRMLNENPGIDFDNPQMPQTQCDLFNHDKYTYVCTYNKANRAKYPYTIRVTKNGTDIVKSDPTIMNNLKATKHRQRSCSSHSRTSVNALVVAVRGRALAPPPERLRPQRRAPVR